MKREKPLFIECVNRVKLERVEEFQDSIFEDVYLSAHMQVERIMEAGHMRAKEDEAEKFCNGNEMSNIISFVGERGMGKSSAMLSFAYFLSEYPRNIKEEPSSPFRFEKDKLKFYTLPKIDAGIVSHESIFDVILAKMWTAFNLPEARENDYRFNRTKDNFNLVKDAYSLYYKDAKDNRNLTSVRQLPELARSLALRENFAELVISFLDYMVSDRNIAQGDRYLVIAIDDLDLANDDSLGILEQLRVLLTVPQVIILTTVDIDKLLMGSKKEFSEKLICKTNVEEFEKNSIRQYANQYIAKVLPRNSRIYMPRYGGTEASKYFLDYDKYVSVIGGMEEKNNVRYFSYINMVIAKHLNILLNYNQDMVASTESLRNIVNKVNELWNICRHKGEGKERLVYEWLEKEIVISLNQLANRKDDISFVKKLFGIAEKDYNAYVIDYVAGQVKNIKQLKRLKKCGYGRILSVLAAYKEEKFENKELVKELVLLYSARIAKYRNEQDYETLEETFIKKDILASVFDEQIFRKFGGETSLNELLRLNLKYEERRAEDVICRNTEVLVSVFKALLFCDMEKVLEKASYVVVTSSERGKELPVYGQQEEASPEKAQSVTQEIELATEGVTSRISVDYFFRNIVQYKKLFDRYVAWMYGQLCKCFLKKEKEDEYQALLDTALKAAVDEAEEMHGLIKKYKITHVYDILPVQNVELMLGIIERIKGESETGRTWRRQNVANVLQKLAGAFAEEFEKAENNCAYRALGYESYAEKMRDLVEGVHLEAVPAEVMNKIITKGNIMEDTTWIP